MAGVAGALNRRATRLLFGGCRGYPDEIELRPVTQPGTSRMRRTRQPARDIVIAFTFHPRRSRQLMAHPLQG
jgi:hypothetical protein